MKNYKERRDELAEQWKDIHINEYAKNNSAKEVSNFKYWMSSRVRPYKVGFDAGRADFIGHELLAIRDVLVGLLNDIQHAGHNCNDIRCPVNDARKMISHIDNLMEKK